MTCRNWVCLCMLLMSLSVRAEYRIKAVNFLNQISVDVNAAGPLLVRMDIPRNRIIIANTLSSSLSVIDGQTHAVVNIPISGRALQHLKSEAMTISQKTGRVYLVGVKNFHIIDPETKTARSLPTTVQFESITIDDNTGNVFIAGRESAELGFYDAKSEKLYLRPWLNSKENLLNLNQTPPPPIRRVVADQALKKIIAIDGYTSTLYLFDAEKGRFLKSRKLALTVGGRWHLAGYNEQSHSLYLVTETAKREVIEAAKINILGTNDNIVQLPRFTEGVGIVYNPERDEVYIPYDNHATVHVVRFEKNGSIDEIKIPAYGNDASALDAKHDFLYIGSWAHGEVDIIDLANRALVKRITGLGLLPHSFSMTFNPNNNLLYIPKGATAVNGTFGAAINTLNPLREQYEKIYTGWAPTDLVELEHRNSFLVFNSEDQFAEVFADGRYDIYELPEDYPIQAIRNNAGNIYLSYGPHQSYWPVVYIWGAKNGILTIDAGDFHFYDRRIPRQAQQMVLDKNGALYFTQNNWGKEEQFLGQLPDPIRLFDISQRVALGDEIERETTQRLLEYDAELQRFYLVRTGERETDPSILQIIAADSHNVIQKITVGRDATDMVVCENQIYIANFASNTVSIIDKNDFRVTEMQTDPQPLKLCRYENSVFVLNHGGKSLQNLQDSGHTFHFPQNWLPDNFFVWNDKILITAHNSDALYIALFEPQTNAFSLLHEEKYAFGETRFDSGNVSFYLNGQFGDAIFSITQGKVAQDGRFWLTDFLSGKLFIIEQSSE